MKKFEEEKKEGGFTTVEVQDNFVNKGVIVAMGLEASNNTSFLADVGDVVLFAKYSPDTHEIEVEGEKLKVINKDDVLAII